MKLNKTIIIAIVIIILGVSLIAAAYYNFHPEARRNPSTCLRHNSDNISDKDVSGCENVLDNYLLVKEGLIKPKYGGGE